MSGPRDIQNGVMKCLFKRPSHAWLCLSALLVAVIGAGCIPSRDGEAETGWAARGSMEPGRLRVDDMVVVVFSGVPVPPERFEGRIKQSGTNGVISLSHIGEIQAAGKTPGELEQDIKNAYLKKGIYRDSLNVTVNAESRFFNVIGEVRGANRYVHSGEMRILGAISTAGGFTDFANKNNVQILRVNGKIEHVNCRRALKNPKLNVLIYPGDQIYVPRRLY